MPRPRITTDVQDAVIAAKREPDAVLAARLGLTVIQVINRRYQLRVRSRPHAAMLRSPLRGREAEVRAMITAGRWMPEMAADLKVSLGTVAGFIYRRKLRRRAISRFDDPRVMEDRR